MRTTSTSARAFALAAAAAAAAAACHTRVQATGTATLGAGSAGTARAGSATPPGAPDDGVPWDRAGVDWTTPPAPLPAAPYQPPAATEWQLANGARVILIENHRLPLINLRLAIAGAGASNARSGLASLTADLLDEGAGKRGSAQLAEAFESLGSELRVGVDRDRATLTLDTTPDQLAPALALVADVVQRPSFAAAEVKRVLAERIEDVRTRADDPEAVARMVFAQLVYAGQPYAEPAAGFVDTLGALGRADVVSFWKQAYTADRATFIVAGDVDRATLAASLERSFGGWKPSGGGALGSAPPTRGVEPSTAPRLIVVDRPGAPQSVVFIGGHGPDAGDPSYDAAELANTALGGTFASRLNRRLREELGYTYGIGTSYERGARAGAWRVSTSLRTDVTVDGIREALAIIAATRAEPLPAGEFAKTQAYLIQQLPQGFETNGSITASFDDLVRRARPLTDYATFERRITALTPTAAKGAIAATWHQLSVVVVGDLGAIGDLRGLGLPLTQVDTDGVPRPAPAP